MTKVLINFANGFFYKSQRYNSKTGLEVGGFDRAISYARKDIDREFFEQNRRILSCSKGAGYWLWKPYFIVKTLNLLQTDDFLFYCDSGAHFIKSIDALVDTSQMLEQDIIPFDVGFTEKMYTKRDALILMDCDTPSYTDTAQRLASFILIKKSKSTVDFAHEYLEFARDERILTDLENQLGYPNYPEFKAHRHDQSTFSLLTKQYSLLAHRDPSQWGNGGQQAYPHSQYGQLIEHTRAKNISVSLTLIKMAKNLLQYFGPQTEAGCSKKN